MNALPSCGSQPRRRQLRRGPAARFLVPSVLLVLVSPLAASACGDADSGTDAATSTATATTTTDTAAPDASESIGQCELTNITEATTESCYNCMITRCCEEMRACDQDADCVFCINNPIDSSERCVDPQTFSVYPNRKNLGTCQTDKCVPPCGADSGSACTPVDCAWYCSNHASGCR